MNNLPALLLFLTYFMFLYIYIINISKYLTSIAYITSELSSSTGYKVNQLRSALYLHEPETASSNVSSGDNANTYLQTRKGWISESKTVNFSTKLYLDIFNTKRALPPKTKLYLNLSRSEDKFPIIKEADDANEYKIKIINLKLILRLIEPHHDILKTYQNLLNKQDYHIPMSNTIVKSFSILSGNPTWQINRLNHEKWLPRQIVITMVDRTNFNGTTTTNPFIFKHNDIKRLDVKLDSGKILRLGRENTPIKFNKDTHSGIAAYRKLMNNTGHDSFSSDCGISFEKYISESFFIVFNLFDHDQCNGFHKHQPQQGNYDIYFEFNEDLPQDVEVIVLNTYNATLTIDHRNKTIFHNTGTPPERNEK